MLSGIIRAKGRQVHGHDQQLLGARAVHEEHTRLGLQRNRFEPLDRLSRFDLYFRRSPARSFWRFIRAQLRVFSPRCGVQGHSLHAA